MGSTLSVLFELIKNSRKSDREIARTLRCWQSTVSRYRKKLEKAGVIQEYTLVPDLRKMGYELLCFSFLKIRAIPTSQRDRVEKTIRTWLSNRSEVIFATDGIYGESKLLVVSLHKSVSSYGEYTSQLSSCFGKFLEQVKDVMMSLETEHMLKPFSLKYLEN